MEGKICEKRAVFRTLLKAAACLHWWRNKPEKGIALLKPYWDCEGFDIDKEKASRVMMSLVRAVTADCYRALEQYQEAANWYQDAAVYHQSSGFASLYAMMVIDQEMTDCYESALECLLAAKERPKRRIRRTFFYYWLVFKGWLQPEKQEYDRRQPTLILTLQRLTGKLD